MRLIEMELSPGDDPLTYLRVLQFVYTSSKPMSKPPSQDDVPAGATLAGELRAYRIADMLQVPERCMDMLAMSVAEVVMASHDRSMDAGTVEEWYRMPLGLREHNRMMLPRGSIEQKMLRLLGVRSAAPDTSTTTLPAADAPAAVVKRLVVAAFGDVKVLMTCSRMRLLFEGIPIEALLTWAKSDDLIAESENVVFMVLDRWICARRPGRKETDELARSLRVANLSPSFLLSVLPAASWLSTELRAQVNTIAIHKLMASTPQAPAVTPCGDSVPPMWTAAPRSGRGEAAPTPAGGWIVWDVTGEQLRSLDAAGSTGVIASHTVHVNGTTMRLLLSSRPKGDEAQVPRSRTVAIHVEVLHPDVMTHKLVFFLSGAISCGKVHKDVRNFTVAKSRVGFIDIFGKAAETAYDAALPHLDATGNLLVRMMGMTFF